MWKSGLAGVSGVESVTVSYAAELATVRYDETRQVTTPFMEPTIFGEACHD